MRVSADIDTGIITVFLERGFVPDNYGAAFEDQHDHFRHGVTFMARKVMTVNLIRYLYDGKPIEDYFSESDRGLVEAPEKSKASLEEQSGFVAASHGFYFHHRYQDWRLQRDPGFGVQEDLITPHLADELTTLLQLRSNLPTARARSLLKDVVHEESDQEWWKVAARYRIEQAYPEERTIWHSQEARPVYGLRDYNEDMNSRPLLANHLGNVVAFHLHTNGSPSPKVRGSEVIVQPGRAESLALARSVLCSMQELIHSTEGYEAFPVASAPSLIDKAENRLAKMPSIIVEAAYHSNPDDALALQDPIFREASMKGVEKGYRLWREGKNCTPLKVDPIATISVAAGQSRVVDIAFGGFPQYPVVIETKNVGCPPGWKCADGAVTLPDADSKPAQITLRCENAGSAPIFWDTRMVDDDGVKSAPVRHIVQCVRGSGGFASQAVHAEDDGAATARRLP